MTWISKDRYKLFGVEGAEPHLHRLVALYISCHYRNDPRYQGAWGQHGVYLGPTGPRWAPCCPHELCNMGRSLLVTGICARTINGTVFIWCKSIFSVLLSFNINYAVLTMEYSGRGLCHYQGRWLSASVAVSSHSIDLTLLIQFQFIYSSNLHFTKIITTDKLTSYFARDCELSKHEGNLKGLSSNGHKADYKSIS